MNNNFKKLLASAMALAMVTSVMPATNVDAASRTCTISDKNKANEYAEAIVADIKAAGYTLKNIPVNATTQKGKEESIEWNNVNSLIEEKVEGATSLADVIASLTTLSNAKNCTNISDDAKYISNLVDGTTALKQLNDAMNNWFDKDGVLDDKEISVDEWTGGTTSSHTDGLEGDYAKLVNTEKYLGNIENTIDVETFKDNIAAFKDYVADYKADYSDDFLNIYVNDLKEKFAVELTAFEKNTTYSRDNLDGLKEALEDEVESDEYAQFGSEDEVAEIIDTIETMIDNMETVNEILASDAAKGIRSARRKVAAYVKLTDDDALDYINPNFTEEDVENIVNYVEEVVNEFYTFETKKRSVSGNYYVVKEATELAMYLNSGDVNADVITMLDTIFEDKLSDTYYDVLVAEDLSQVTKEELMEMVDAAKNIELKWHYTTSEAEKVWDAVYAVNELLGNREEYDITAREARTLEKLKVKFDAIDDRLGEVDAEVDITKDWWVFENGQWVFYQDGKVAPNRWVADHNNDWYYAGANGVMLTNAWIARDSKLDVWYYVGADGKMVTNTTVDGCVIDANGVWHA